MTDYGRNVQKKRRGYCELRQKKNAGRRTAFSDRSSKKVYRRMFNRFSNNHINNYRNIMLCR
jgi:hypothetical protein